MNRILLLVKKDGKHLAPQIAVLWVLMAVACYSDYSVDFKIPLGARIILQILATLAPLLCATLVVTAIQQESLIGNRQYWVTRPFTWRDLLVSKLLLLTLALNVPLFVFQAASLALHGLPPYLHLSELFWRQAFFTAFFVLMPAALAVITRAPGHALAMAFVAAAAFYVEMMFLERHGPFGPSWGIWIAVAVLATLSVTIGSVVLWLQYRRRRPAVPRVLFACLVLLFAPATTLPWAAAWKIEPRLSTRTVAPGEFLISFDPRTERPPYYPNRDPRSVHLEIPIRISGLSNDDRLVFNRLRFTPAMLSARVDPWADRGWVRDNMVHDVVDGAGWLDLYVDQAVYARFSDGPIDLRGAADLTLFVRTQTVELRSSAEQIRDVGVCLGVPKGCVSALPRASVETWIDRSFVSYLVVPKDTYSPFPTDIMLNPVQKLAAAPGTLVVRKPVAWFTRSFEFRTIRLADFVR